MCGFREIFARWVDKPPVLWYARLVHNNLAHSIQILYSLPTEFIQIIASKTVVCLQLYCNTHTFISVLYHFPLQSYYLSPSYSETLNNPIILHSTWGVCTFHIYNSYPYTYYISTTYISFSSTLMNIPLKLSTSLRTNHTKVCSLMKNLTSLAPR